MFSPPLRSNIKPAFTGIIFIIVRRNRNNNNFPPFCCLQLYLLTWPSRDIKGYSCSLPITESNSKVPPAFPRDHEIKLIPGVSLLQHSGSKPSRYHIRSLNGGIAHINQNFQHARLTMTGGIAEQSCKARKIMTST